MADRTHENVTIWKSTLALLRLAASAATLKTGSTVSQVQFMDEAVREKVERDGLTELVEMVQKQPDVMRGTSGYLW